MNARQHTWGSRIKLAKAHAEHARKRAVEATREADRAEGEALVGADGRLWWPRSALTNDRSMHQRRFGLA